LLTRKTSFRSLFSGLVPLFILAHFVHHLVNALPTPMLPLIRNEFSLDYARSGLVISAFQLSYGISQVPSGWLADRIGARLVMAIGISGLALAGIMIGLSRTYVTLLVAMILMGILGGGYHPASPPVISAMVPPQNRGRALGLHMIGGAASFFLAPIVAATIATGWGWRAPFIVMAVPAFVFGLVFFLILRRRNIGQKVKIARITENPVRTSRPLGRRHLITFFTLVIFTHAVTYSVVSFIPLYLTDHFGAPKGLAAASISLIYSSGLWVPPVTGYLSDRFGRIPVILGACFLAAPAVYLLNIVPYGLGLVPLLMLIGLVEYAHSPVAQAYILDHISEKHRGTLLGLYFFGNMESGGLFTPLLGLAVDTFGFYTSLNIATVALLGMVTLAALLLRDRG